MYSVISNVDDNTKADTLSYDDFRKFADELVAISNTFNDGWVIEHHGDTMLKKCEFEIVHQAECPSNADCLLKMEYTIYYSHSYNVPVLAFNVWRENGTMLRLEELCDLPLFKLTDKQNLYSAITQQEHQLLQRPYFVIHPCRTSEILAPLKNGSRNLLITFVSVIAPMVGLTFDNVYGVN